MSRRNSEPSPVHTADSNKSRLQYVLRVGAARKLASSLVVDPAAGTVAQSEHCLTERIANLSLFTVGARVSGEEINTEYPPVDELSEHDIKTLLRSHVAETFTESLILELANDVTFIYNQPANGDVIELRLAQNKEISPIGVFSSRVLIKKVAGWTYNVEFLMSCRDVGAGAIGTPLRTHNYSQYLNAEGLLKNLNEHTQFKQNFDMKHMESHLKALESLEYIQHLQDLVLGDKWGMRSIISGVWGGLNGPGKANFEEARAQNKLLHLIGSFQLLAVSLPDIYYEALHDMLFGVKSRLAQQAKGSFDASLNELQGNNEPGESAKRHRGS